MVIKSGERTRGRQKVIANKGKEDKPSSNSKKKVKQCTENFTVKLQNSLKILAYSGLL